MFLTKSKDAEEAIYPRPYLTTLSRHTAHSDKLPFWPFGLQNRQESFASNAQANFKNQVEDQDEDPDEDEQFFVDGANFNFETNDNN